MSAINGSSALLAFFGLGMRDDSAVSWTRARGSPSGAPARRGRSGKFSGRRAPAGLDPAPGQPPRAAASLAPGRPKREAPPARMPAEPKRLGGNAGVPPGEPSQSGGED